jgi:hypothetical protein
VIPTSRKLTGNTNITYKNSPDKHIIGDTSNYGNLLLGVHYFTDGLTVTVRKGTIKRPCSIAFGF